MTEPTKIDIGFLLAHGLSRAAAERLMQEIARVLAVGFVPREELERVKMEAAALREALRQFASGVCSAHQEPDPECETCNIKLRLLPQMIEEHKRVWLEQVKPLVDALRSIEFDRVAADSTGRKPLHVWLSEEKCNAIRDAIDHARKLGFDK